MKKKKKEFWSIECAFSLFVESSGEKNKNRLATRPNRCSSSSIYIPYVTISLFFFFFFFQFIPFFGPSYWLLLSSFFAPHFHPPFLSPWLDRSTTRPHQRRETKKIYRLLLSSLLTIGPIISDNDPFSRICTIYIQCVESSV